MVGCFFFFKQKTAYDMRISDWSSDVCSSDLSGGGRSSGLMSFLKIGDRAAGAIKSGGTTRRAAKMVTVDLDHPDIEAYINWKVVEEQKVAALVTGSKLCDRHLNIIMRRSEGHTSELQSLMRISYAVFCLK